MDILGEVKKRPKTLTAGVTATAVIGFFFAWNSLSPTFEFVVRLQKAPDVAQAALQKATETKEWIDAFIEQQKQQQALDQQRYDLEQEFKKKLFEMQNQQQQAPNQPRHIRPHPQQQEWQEWQDPTDGSWWCCEEDCEVNESWWRCG